MKNSQKLAGALFLFLLNAFYPVSAHADDLLWLDDFNLNYVTQEWGTPQVRLSVDKNPLKLNGVTYERGVGTHSTSEIIMNLKGAATRFEAQVGVDDERAGRGSVSFLIYVDGRVAYESPVLRGGDSSQKVSIDLTGASRMVLMVTDARDGNTHDHADWADAKIFIKPWTWNRPELVAMGSPPAMIASNFSMRTEIHGPSVIGTTPGRPFLYKIPATGMPGLHYSAENLPNGLSINPATGVITGTLIETGNFEVTLTATNNMSSDHKVLVIRSGDQMLSQTPPMGWNSWNVWGCAVDDQKIRQAADYMVSSGLADHGYQYINIDDCWQGERAANDEIQANSKFPNMKALTDYVHSKGLKIGIYSSPGPKTCAGYEGSQGYELRDAQTYADWGFDYLKHDWCSERSPDLKAPYQLMRAALNLVNRDIVYSLCQYGMGQVWTWGHEVGANLWRTTGDIYDAWFSMSGIGFNQNGLETYAGPGHFNDPDMLVVGYVGWGPHLHPTRLTQTEQVTHITLWSMLSAPLLIGADLTRLDDFTLRLLNNDEVIAIDQDPLVDAARRIYSADMREIWGRKLANGDIALALFNRAPEALSLPISWRELGFEGAVAVRDVWQRTDIGVFSGKLEVNVPPHGAVMFRVRGAHAGFPQQKK